MRRGNWGLSLIQFMKSIAVSQNAWLIKSNYSALLYKAGHKYVNYAATHPLIQEEKTRASPKTYRMQKKYNIFKSNIILKCQKFLILHESMQYVFLLFLVDEFHFYFLLPFSSGSDFSNHVWYAHLCFQTWTLVSDQRVAACPKQQYAPQS